MVCVLQLLYYTSNMSIVSRILHFNNRRETHEEEFCIGMTKISLFQRLSGKLITNYSGSAIKNIFHINFSYRFLEKIFFSNFIQLTNIKHNIQCTFFIPPFSTCCITTVLPSHLPDYRNNPSVVPSLPDGGAIPCPSPALHSPSSSPGASPVWSTRVAGGSPSPSNHSSPLPSSSACPRHPPS